ncbi:MAG: tRNA (N6-threonylcarbamoyladenosine(37)-N6)-methyltransferase TrmO [Pirellulaceae bacterium]|nr:tRNA (N6-threonylcarbamoyladenosine(37)-N6)-methyltransferase TrmO [Pirellulaceae bacterium]
MSRFALIFVVIASATAVRASEPAGAPTPIAAEFKVRPIGHVKKSEDRTWIVLDKQYAPGLLGLDGFSHIHVIWWFDQNDTPQKRAVLQVHPRGDRNNPLTGVFACRAPVRPNLIALSLCKVLTVQDNMVEIDQTDAFDGTPVLDIKPYAPGIDSASDVRVPQWAGPAK